MVASIDGEEDTTDALPDMSSCKEFYAKYEVKEILGRCARVRWTVVSLDRFAADVCLLRV